MSYNQLIFYALLAMVEMLQFLVTSRFYKIILLRIFSTKFILCRVWENNPKVDLISNIQCRSTYQFYE